MMYNMAQRNMFAEEVSKVDLSYNDHHIRSTSNKKAFQDVYLPLFWFWGICLTPLPPWQTPFFPSLGRHPPPL